MKRITWALAALFILSACGNDSGETKKEEVPASENDVDAARNFIRAALDGNWDKARTFMIQDSVNTQLIDRFQQSYEQNKNREEQRGYRESNIILYDTQRFGDTAIQVNYANSFKKVRQSLRVVRQGNRWLVDPKATLIGGTPVNMEQVLRDSVANKKNNAQ